MGPPTATPANTTTPAFRPDLQLPPPLEPISPSAILGPTLSEMAGFPRERLRLSQKLRLTLSTTPSTTPPTTPTLTASPPLAPSIPVTGTSTSRPTMEDTDTSESSLLLPPSQPVRQRS